MKLFLFMVLFLVGCSPLIYAEELTEVEKKALFDIFVEIPDDYHNVDVDGEVLFTLKLVNLGGAGRIDVFLEYSILDMDGEVVLDKRETVAIETQASFLREFGLKGIPTGNYEIYARMVYADGKVVDSRHSFEIRSVEEARNLLIWISVGVILFIALGIFLYPKIKLMREKMKIRSKVKGIVRESKRSY